MVAMTVRTDIGRIAVLGFVGVILVNRHFASRHLGAGGGNVL